MLNETPVKASLLHQSGRWVARQVEILKRDFNFSCFAEASRAGLPYLPRIWLDCESVECFSFATVRDKKYRTSKQNSRTEQQNRTAAACQLIEPKLASLIELVAWQQAVASWKLKVASLAARARQRVWGKEGEGGQRVKHSKNRAWLDSLRCQLACRLASISSLLKLPSANRPLLLKLPLASFPPSPRAPFILTVASARIQMNSLNLMNNSVVALKNEGCQQHLMDLKRKGKAARVKPAQI